MANTIDNIPHESSSDDHWITWHKALRKRYGKNNANMLLSQAWEERGEDYANTYQLRTYLKSQGIEIDGTNILSGLTDSAKNTWGSVNKGFSGIGSSVMIGVLIVIAIIGFTTYQAIKN
ncbi:hypothetical protein BKI52_33110 [marine bacterium AO1-C]|nr:hypothetical protein BKI52_33110 [marine bacterium AO1-C]